MRLVLLLPLLAACGVDHLSTNGELGRMSFTLVSDWYLDEHDLTEVPVVTGHAQHIGVTLTGKGERDAKDDAGDIEYRMEPDDGVVVETDGGSEDEDAPAPSVTLTVAEPGSYTLSAVLDGEEFDRIQLAFDAPDALELALYARAPWTEDFVPVEGDGPTQVREGTQLAWLPIPTASGVGRLAGDVAATMSADPVELVVPADNVTHVNEDEVYDSEGVPSLYFVEPGDVTVTITDTENPAVGAHAFTVIGE